MAATRGRPRKATKTTKAAKSTAEAPKRRRGRPPKNKTMEPEPPVVHEVDDDLDADDDDDDSEERSNQSGNPTREELLFGVDEESTMQNKTAKSVMERRANGEKHVHWKGQYNLKYNTVAESCLANFGGESEVEITKMSPKHAHIGIYRLSEIPTWRQAVELIQSNHWTGASERYRLSMMSTGRSIAAVCYLTLEESFSRKQEWHRLMQGWDRSSATAANYEGMNSQQQANQQIGQQGWSQPQQEPHPGVHNQPQPPDGMAGQAPYGQQPPQHGYPPQQQGMPPQGQVPSPHGGNGGVPQPPQPPMPGWPGQQVWQQPFAGPMGMMGQAQPPFPGSPGFPPHPGMQQQPGMPPQPWQQQPGWQQPPWQQPTPQLAPQTVNDDDEDDDDDDTDDDDGGLSFMPRRHNPTMPDPRVEQLEKTIRGLNKQIRQMQAQNQTSMSQASSQQNYQQQLYLWTMLQQMNQQLEQVRAQVQEERAQKEEQLRQAQGPQPAVMTMEQVQQLVEERLQQERQAMAQQQTQQPAPQPPMDATQMNPAMMPPYMQAQYGYPPYGMSQQPQSKTDEDDFERSLKKVTRMKKLIDDISPRPPEPPPWMSQMMPAPPQPNPAVPSDTKAEDGSPLKVWDMGPFRYVTDTKGKAVDFFTMMALNADNVKSWVEPAIKAVGDLKQQIQDAQKQQETGEIVQMLELMHRQILENKQIQDQQISELNRRLAPAPETIQAMQQGMMQPGVPQQQVQQAPPDPAPKPQENEQEQPGRPVASGVPSRAAPKGLLDGLANARKALENPSSDS